MRSGCASAFVDFVDRDDDGHAGRFGVIDGFERLRHDAVVGRDHQHHDVGDLRAAGAHARERFMAGRVDEHDLAAVLLDVIRADVLRDAAGLAVGHVGGANGVQQRSLAVIDVAHDGNHGRAPHAIGSLFGQLDLLRALFLVADLVGGSAEFARQISSAILTSRFWLMVAKIFFSTSFLITRLALMPSFSDKLLDGDAFGNRDLAIDRRRRSGLLAPRRRHPQSSLFLLHVAMAIASCRAWLDDGAAARWAAAWLVRRAGRRGMQRARPARVRGPRPPPEPTPGPRITGWPGRMGPR